jgi:hypothetical protein
LIAAAILVVAGCEDIDWDWESRWWNQPTRQVRPSRTVSRSRPRPGESAAPRSDSQPRVAPGGPNAPSVHSPEPVAETPPESTSPPRPAGEEFFQLYLISEAAPLRAAQNIERVVLQNVPARLAAQVIAQWFVPIGMGGGDHQHYLIYQDADEYRAAIAAVPWVDVAPGSEGSAAPLGPAIRMLLDTLRAGAAPTRESVNKCQTELARIAFAVDAKPSVAWAAGMLAGRLASDHLFQFETARTYFDAAAKQAAPDSVERLAALWARAESFDLGGDTPAARRECERIVREFAGHPRSQAVMRASAVQASRR